FLRAQQCPSGAWWGRWTTNYLASTSFVFLGLDAVGADLSAPYVRRAVAWVRDRQNRDGGWGERPETYRDPSLAGQGPSTPTLTSLVLWCLLAAGEKDSNAVRRGIDYLLSRQRADGTWLNQGYVHAYIPPDTFYHLPEASRYYPLEALARYLDLAEGETGVSGGRVESGEGASVQNPAEGRFTDALLGPMRQKSDPEADALGEEIFKTGQ